MTTNADEAHARLTESRVELQQMLDSGEEGSADVGGTFPRSRTMRLVTEHPVLAVAAVLVGGTLLLRSGSLRRLVRALPLASMGRIFLVKYLGRSLNERGAKQ